MLNVGIVNLSVEIGISRNPYHQLIVDVIAGEGKMSEQPYKLFGGYKINLLSPAKAVKSVYG